MEDPKSEQKPSPEDPHNKTEDQKNMDADGREKQPVDHTDKSK